MHVMVQFWVAVFVIKHRVNHNEDLDCVNCVNCVNHVNDIEDLDNEQEHFHYEHSPPQLASASGILVLEDRCPWIA